MKKMFHFSEYLQQKYQRPMQRIPIDLALGCPNRCNGGFGDGCIFCSEDGARARHLTRTSLALEDQVRRGVEYVRRRYGNDCGFIAYFQSFTSTFAPVKRLKELYEEVLQQADFKVVIISTRPDALPDEVLDYLEELSQRYELFVELGIQTSHDRTLQEINRGHDFAEVKKACYKLHERNIKIVGHFILGLPGESFEDWLITAKEAAKLPLTAVKIHQLMVLKNTVLARRYGENINYVKPLNEYEYASGLKAFLQCLPENILLMRLMADAADDMLIAPRWWMKKGQFLSFFADYFYNSSGNMESFVPVKTADGSFTLYHPGYRQHFHTLAGADSEGEKKFAEPSDLRARLQQSADTKQTITLLDIGFGLGGNTFAALKCAQEFSQAQLVITALEIDIRTISAASGLYEKDSVEHRILTELMQKQSCCIGNVEINLILDDARNSIQKMPSGSFDLLWLDAFSSDVNPELWSWQFFKECCRVMKNDAVLLTYSSAPGVRGGLFKAGLNVAETPSFGRRRCGTIATRAATDFDSLSVKEKHIIFDSTAGVPYSDPGLNNQAAWITEHRKKLVEKLRKRGIPKWYREPKVNSKSNS